MYTYFESKNHLINNDIIFKVGSTKFDLESDNQFEISESSFKHGSAKKPLR